MNHKTLHMNEKLEPNNNRMGDNSGRIRNFCSTSGTRRVILDANPLIKS